MREAAANRMLSRVSRAVFFSAFAVFVLAAEAKAEINVSGSRESATVEVKNAPLSQVIAALNAKLNVRISYALPADPAIDGTYSGSLRQLLMRLFNGQNFILKSFGDRIAVVFPGNRGPARAEAPVPVAHAQTVPDGAATPNVQGWTGAFTFTHKPQ